MRRAAVFLLLLLLLDCKRVEHASSQWVVLKRFPTEPSVVYEEIQGSDLKGMRVLSFFNPLLENEMIILPGDVLTCERNGTLICGRKAAVDREFADSALDNEFWKKSGFFVLDPMQAENNVVRQVNMYNNALWWFETDVGMREFVVKRLNQQ